MPIDITFDDSQPDNLNSINNDLIGSDPFSSLNLGILGNIGLGAFGQGFNGPPTTQGKTHLGIASCNLVKDYVNAYPCLREVSILLKEFLAVNDFNVAYKGKQYPSLIIELRRNKLVQRGIADCCVHEQLQAATESPHHPCEAADGFPRLLLQLL